MLSARSHLVSRNVLLFLPNQTFLIAAVEVSESAEAASIDYRNLRNNQKSKLEREWV